MCTWIFGVRVIADSYNFILKIIIRFCEKHFKADPTSITNRIMSFIVRKRSSGRVDRTFSDALYLNDINQTTPQDSINVSGEFKNVLIIY
jgi:hypothetical protein